MQYPPFIRSIQLLFVSASFIFLCGNSDALAQAPDLINFQAQMGDNSPGSASATFSIYDALVGGNVLWEETHSTISMENGFLNIMLGSRTPFPTTLFTDDGQRYIELAINGETLSPRLQLTSVTYALRAQVADELLTPTVSSINGVSEALSIEGGNNIEVVQDGQVITINSNQPGAEGGINVINPGNGIDVSDTNGPTTTISIEDDSISDQEIQDNSITRASLSPNAAVFSLNGLSNDVILTGGSNVDVDQSGQTITINAESSGGGISTINPGNGIDVANSNGPTATISIEDNSISDQEIQNNSISRSSLAPNAAVFSLNGISNDIILTGGSNVDVDQSGQTITINASSSGGGITTINPGTGITVSDSDGPSTTIGIQTNSITDAQIADNSLSQASLASGTAVLGINGVTDQVNLVGGSNVDVVRSGQTLTINATSTGGGGGNIQSISGGNGINVSQPNGPNTTISLQNNSITDTQIANNSLTSNSLAANSVGSSELNNQIVLGSNGRLEIENSSGQTRSTLTTSNGGGFLGIDTSNDVDAVTIEALNGNAYGLVTVHTLTGAQGVRIWGDQTGGGLAGAALAVFKRDGSEASTWIRTMGSANNSWGVIGVSDANGDEVITLNGQNGNVSVAGNLSKGGGSFKIDHPLDPANKYLSHSFVESPDMMNIYNGNVVLDAEGTAWVEMPEWFEALNRDFRYQLTCIGGFAQVYIAEEITNGRFQIAGGTPGLKVSWQVTGVRHDPFAEKHRIAVEEDKPADQRGTFLHPDVYEQP